MCTKTVIHLKDYWYSIVATYISVNYYGIRIDEKILRHGIFNWTIIDWMIQINTCYQIIFFYFIVFYYYNNNMYIDIIMFFCNVIR